MRKVRLMGAAEIQDRLGLARSSVSHITSRKGFPEPYQKLRMGSVWDAEDVEAGIREHRPEDVEG